MTKGATIASGIAVLNGDSIAESVQASLASAGAAAGSWAAAMPFVAAVADCMECGLMLIGDDDRVVFVSRPMAAILGSSTEQLSGMAARDLMLHLADCVEDPPALLRSGQLIPTGTQICCEEFAIVKPQRSIVRWVAHALRNPAPMRVISCEDITAAVELTARYERMSSTDRLTGLVNRRAGEVALNRELALARRKGAALSVAMLDLDHFKKVNDRHGHATGDEVLRGFGHLVMTTLRASDVPIRWGGEEFLLVLPSTGLDAAQACVTRLQGALHATILSQTAGRITMSAGLAELMTGEDASTVVSRADARLYAAKESGRDCIRS